MSTEAIARNPVGAVVAVVAVMGALALSAAATVTGGLPVPAGDPGLAGVWVVLVFVAAATVAEIVYVPLQHGEGLEELTFFEFVVVAGMMVLSPAWAIAAPLLGLALALAVMRRPLVKIAFNLGSYATSTAAAVMVYLSLADGASRFSFRAVLALFVAMGLFVAVNSTFLALILHAAQGIRRRTVVRDIWGLSGLMSVGGIGVGAVAVAVADTAPSLLPFTLLPALALWYAYRAAAEHVLERERNRWLVVLALALAGRHSASDLLEVAPDAIRRAFGAGLALVLLPGEPQLPLLETDEPVTLTSGIPNGWASAVATRLDLGADATGALLLGSAVGADRSWRLREADSAVLRALAASLGSALRGAEHLEALVEETGKLKAVVEHASDGIVVVGDAGQVRLWSPAMARISGVSEHVACAAQEPMPSALALMVEASGLAPTGARHGGVGPDEADPDREVREVLPLTLTRPDGEERSLQVSVVRVRHSQDGARVAILTVHDVTAERRVDRLKSDFVATISHELRTPITPIKGYAQLLASRGEAMTPERRRQALDLIAERADHLARLVDDLLMASRVSGASGAKLAVVGADNDLRVLVAQAIASFPQLAARLEVDVPEESVDVHCDGVRTVQCLTNLLSNAGKYAPDHTPITVRLTAPGLDETAAVVTVSDCGPGIPASEQERVFERFYRVEDPMTMQTGGSGLGLYIARELATAMGGQLSLTSSPGEGCTFALRLPLVGVAVDPTGVATPERSE